MKRYNIASLEQLILALYSMNTCSLYYVGRTESIISSHFHTKALSNASYVSAYITKSKDT